MPLEFSRSSALSLGVELELQLVGLRDHNLTRAATDLLAAIGRRRGAGEIKPEVTESMIEIATGVHRDHAGLVAELTLLRDELGEAARRLNVGVAGGGTHPFQQWSERRIYDAERFKRVSELYGYLAKQYTVFGQHIHVGCASGDDAVYLTRALARYMPQFIALAASSPFFQGADTLFDSSRLNVVTAFPLSGTMPAVADWVEFERYFDRMRGLRIADSMKDFYWDIRPKPEFGTIEIRVCDTPLTVGRAAALAVYAQAIAAWLLAERPAPDPDLPLAYTYNRFQACRFGLDGVVVDPASAERGAGPRIVPIAADAVDTITKVMPHAERLGSAGALAGLLALVGGTGNDARRLREIAASGGALTDVVREQLAAWSA